MFKINNTVFDAVIPLLIYVTVQNSIIYYYLLLCG